MTKQEVNEIITSKAAEYGFELEENSMGWSNKRTGQDYINIQIFQNSNLEKTDWEKRIGCIDIEASASVSRMGGSPTPEELLKAADEIARGAKFTADIQNMKLSSKPKQGRGTARKGGVLHYRVQYFLVSFSRLVGVMPR